MFLTLGALFAFACALARAAGNGWMIAAAGTYVLLVTLSCTRLRADWRVPLLLCLTCCPYLYDQTSLFRLNPELANVYVMPVLSTIQPLLLPLATAAAAAYALWENRWARTVLLAALWSIAIQFLFSMRLEPFAAIAEIDR